MRKPTWITLLAAGLLTALSSTALAAAPPFLVKDLNPFPRNAGSDPRRFFTLASGVGLFVADDGEAGLELWRSDGTPAGTFRLTDDACGTCWSGELLFPWVQAGDRAFVFSADAQRGTVLWVTDGSRTGTFPVLEGTDVDWNQLPVWVESLGLLFFVAGDDATTGRELWRTDGTPAGTHLVKELGFRDTSGGIRELTAFRGRVYFHARDHRGPALWTSDGTAAGTVLVRDPWRDESSHAGPSWLRVVGSRLLFFAEGPGFGNELWASDGTTRGTRPIADLVPGPPGPPVFDAVPAGGRLYFIADAGKGQELWVSDGTRTGTRALTDFPSPYAFGDVPFLPRQPLLGGRLYFSVNDSVHGFEVWSTDGTRAGTRLLRDVCPGACPGALGVLNVAENRLLFGAADGVHGVELWRSDGTAQGTRLVRDLCPGACSSYPGPTWRAGGRLLLAASTAAGRQLWRTDGTSSGTVRISSFAHGVTDLFVGQVPGALLLRIWDADHGDELWISNGTRPGTRLLADIRTEETGGSFPRLLTPMESGLAFLADAPGPEGEVQAGLWATDGTAAGTVSVAMPPACRPENGILPRAGQEILLFCPFGEDLALVRTGAGVPEAVRLTPPGLSVIYSHEAVVAGGSVFFVGQDNVLGRRELWVSDGATEAKRVTAFAAAAEPEDLAAFQGRVLFRGWSEGSGHELWVSDGTTAGTKPLTQGDLRPDLLGEHGGRFWFAATTLEEGRELWSTDGTAGGTRRLADFDPDLAPQRLISAGTRMFLAASTGLWVSDGTSGGTRRVGDESLETDAVAAAGHLFYSTFLPDEGEVLWQSDGTAAGTGPVLGSTEAGGHFRSPLRLNLLGNRLYFLWEGGLWSTDGTPAGATRIDAPEAPAELTRSGDRLFFRARDPELGTELWAVEP